MGADEAQLAHVAYHGVPPAELVAHGFHMVRRIRSTLRTRLGLAMAPLAAAVVQLAEVRRSFAYWYHI